MQFASQRFDHAQGDAKFTSVYLDIDSESTTCMVCGYFTVYWIRVASLPDSRSKFQFTSFASQFNLPDSRRNFQFTGFASQISVYWVRAASFQFTGFASQFSVYWVRVAIFSLLGSRRKFQFTGFASQVKNWIRVASFSLLG